MILLVQILLKAETSKAESSNETDKLKDTRAPIFPRRVFESVILLLNI
jgi:hypothetical protein